jgi:uncharacterized protein YgiB involved in biofilm formation
MSHGKQEALRKVRLLLDEAEEHLRKASEKESLATAALDQADLYLARATKENDASLTIEESVAFWESVKSCKRLADEAKEERVIATHLTEEAQAILKGARSPPS